MSHHLISTDSIATNATINSTVVVFSATMRPAGCRFVIILWDYYMNVNRVTAPLSVAVNGQTPVQVICCQSGTCIKTIFPEKILIDQQMYDLILTRKCVRAFTFK